MHYVSNIFMKIIIPKVFFFKLHDFLDTYLLQNLNYLSVLKNLLPLAHKKKIQSLTNSCCSSTTTGGPKLVVLWNTPAGRRGGWLL